VPQGLPAIYTSATLSLAALELFVHTDPDLLPADLLVISADIPDDLGVHELKLSDLPGTWREIPAPAELQELGRSWIVAGRAATLSVPSVVVPTERHYVLNPAHAGFHRIHLGDTHDFSFDPRMWKRKARGANQIASFSITEPSERSFGGAENLAPSGHGASPTGSVLRHQDSTGRWLIQEMARSAQNLRTPFRHVRCGEFAGNAEGHGVPITAFAFAQRRTKASYGCAQ